MRSPLYLAATGYPPAGALDGPIRHESSRANEGWSLGRGQASDGHGVAGLAMWSEGVRHLAALAAGPRSFSGVRGFFSMEVGIVAYL